jgi:hypothetical protein
VYALLLGHVCFKELIPVQSGEAAGSFWLASPGGGTQFYFLNHNIQYYIDNGYLSPF